MPLDALPNQDWHDAQALMRAQLPAIGQGLIPALHLRRFAATATPKVAIIGDSTSLLEGNNSIGFANTLWGYLATRLREDNPSKTITFGNYGIGGSTMSQYGSTGTTLTGAGLTLPSWFGTPANTWISYLSAFAPDVVFVNWGVNDAYTLTTNTLTGFLAALAGFSKIPDIVFITGKSANPGAGGVYAAANYVAGRLNAAALLRSVSQSNARGINVSSLPPIGLIDIGRAWEIAALGRDPCLQDLVLRQSAVTGITSFPYDFAQTEGDLVIDMTWPAQALTLYSGTPTTITLYLGEPSGGNVGGSFIQFTSNNGTAFYANYYPGGGTNVVQGNTNNWGTGDITMRVHAVGSRLMVYTNGVLSLDVQVPRYGSFSVPRIALTNPPASPNMTINTYATGRMRRGGPQMSRAQAWGTAGGAGLGAGNGINHAASEGLVRVDRWVLQNTPFHVPQGPSRTSRIHTGAGAVVITRDDDLVIVTKATGAATAATLPADFVPGKHYGLKDGKRDAGTNNITVTPASGTVEGSATKVISTNGKGLWFARDAGDTDWKVVGVME